MKKTIPFVLLLIFFVAAAWYSLMREPDPVHEVAPPSLSLEPLEQAQPVEPEYEPAPALEPPPLPEPLPALDESDVAITAALAEIAGDDTPAQYLVKNQAISRLVAVVDSLDARQVPPPVNPFKTPEGKFLAVEDGDRYLISAENATRYDAHVRLFSRLDSEALIVMYDRYQPLFQQAWQDNGGEGSFDDRLVEIIDHLLATPEVGDDIYLVKPEAVYLYADPELEALSAGQKILLRIGPENAAVVKAKLVEIRELLS
jgi:hypothetical protein